MTELIKGIETLMAEERVRADRANAPRFASPHEAYGVIMEELLEAEDEYEDLMSNAMRLMLAIRDNNTDKYVSTLKRMQDYTVHAAAELVQVATMCAKAVDSVGGSDAAD